MEYYRDVKVSAGRDVEEEMAAEERRQAPLDRIPRIRRRESRALRGVGCRKAKPPIRIETLAE